MRAKLKTSWFFYASIVFLLAVFCFSDKASSSDEFTRVAQARTSGKVKEFRLTAPANLGGNVSLQVGDEDGCLVEFECWARAKDRKMAKEFTELVKMYLETEDEVVTVKLTTPRNAPWEGTNHAIKVTLDIYVPPDIMVETKTKNFCLDISGPLKRVDIRNSYGKVEVRDVSEETNINGSYNKVEVENIEGNLEIETSYNKIYVEGVDTKGGKAYLKTSYAKIEVEDFTGQLEAYTVYSPICCSNIILLGGTNEIKTVYSKIDLELEEVEDCKLYVNNSYGNINVVAPRDLSARLILTVGRGGKINTSRILIKPRVLEKTRLEGICGDGDSEIELDIDGIGKILLEGR